MSSLVSTKHSTRIILLCSSHFKDEEMEAQKGEVLGLRFEFRQRPHLSVHCIPEGPLPLLSLLFAPTPTPGQHIPSPAYSFSFLYSDEQDSSALRWLLKPKKGIEAKPFYKPQMGFQCLGFQKTHPGS